MAEITAQMVKQLRDATGAGVLDCRKALVEYDGDVEKATNFLREKGLASAAKKAGREAREGKVELYSHSGGRIGVMVEVNCETDFVARTEQFQTFAHELALHIAASGPKFMDVASIPAAVLEAERNEARSRAVADGKPEKVIEKIIEGRLEKFYKDSCLMSQAYIRDDSITITELLKQTIASIGENVIIRRFVRWELGEEVGA